MYVYRLRAEGCTERTRTGSCLTTCWLECAPRQGSRSPTPTRCVRVAHSLTPPANISVHVSLISHAHCTRPGQGLGNDGFLYYAMYCTHYTGQGQGHGTIVFYCASPVPFPGPGPIQYV